MKIVKDRVVTLEYKLSTEKGELIESSVGRGVPVAFIQGRGFMLPGLDSRLEGLEGGDKKDFDLPPEEAFGTVEQQQVKTMSKKEFPEDAELTKGSKFQAKLPTVNLQITLEILEEEDDSVEVRMIHPYADKTIHCEIEIIGVRAAAPGELETGIVSEVSTGPAKAPPPPPNVDPDSLEELDLDPDEDDDGDDKEE